MAYTDPQSWPHCPYMVYICIWLYVVYMAYTDPQSSWPHCPIYDVYMAWYIRHIQTHTAGRTARIWCIWLYRCIWHLQTPRASPTAPYMVYIMAWRIWHIHTHAAGPTALYCIWCIWHIQTPRARAPTSPYMMYIWHGLQYTAYTDPHSWSHSPRLYMVYMAVYGVYAIYRSPRAGAKALYGVYDILRPPDLTPQSCMRYIYGCIWCIWHIQTTRAGPTALYMVCMAVCRHPYTNIYTWGHVYGVYVCICYIYRHILHGTCLHLERARSWPDTTWTVPSLLLTKATPSPIPSPCPPRAGAYSKSLSAGGESQWNCEALTLFEE